MVGRTSEGDPYRGKLPALAPLTEDLVWRRRASRGVAVLLWALILRIPVGVAFPLVGGSLFELIVAWATWLFTTPRAEDVRATHRLGQYLRYLAVAGATLYLAPFLVRSRDRGLGQILETLGTVVQSLLPVIGMLYVSARLRTSGLARAARRAKQVAFVLVVPVGIMVASRFWLGAPVPQIPDTSRGILFWTTLGLGMIDSVLMLSGLLYALVLTRKLRRALRVVSQEWWLDTNALPRVEWVSYARLGDGRAEVLFADHHTQRFHNKQQAHAWLEESGFVSGRRALEQRLVDRGPPAPALPPRPRS